MSDTPRMDVIWNHYLNDDYGYCDYASQLYLEGQKLEVELAAAIAQRDKALAFLQVYRNDTPLGRQPHMIAHEVDPFLTECGK
jgi:hypothetical protein